MPGILAQRLRALRESGKTARDVMTAGVRTVRAETDLATVVRLMAGWRVKRLPVTDETGALVGMVSRADVLRALAAVPETPAPAGRALLAGGRTVADAVITGVPMVAPGTPVEEVVRQVLETPLRRVVVADREGRVLGLISDRDLIVRSRREAHPWLARLLGGGPAPWPRRPAGGGEAPRRGRRPLRGRDPQRWRAAAAPRRAGEGDMRILAISDLHANWPALEAVLAAEPFDGLLVGGDLVSYGPHPREVVDLVRQRAWVAVRGNHDQALAHGVDCRCAPASKPLAEATRAVHRELLAPADVEFLGRLPATAAVEDGTCALFLVHASPRDHFYRYTLTPEAPAAHLQEEIQGVQARYILLGHTHLPMVRPVGAQVVINPGSVGQPRDGDPRASYAVIEDGVVSLRRAAYDVERTIRDLRALPVAAGVVERLAGILRTGRA
jgi:putative phosphoesterase